MPQISVRPQPIAASSNLAPWSPSSSANIAAATKMPLSPLRPVTSLAPAIASRPSKTSTPVLAPQLRPNPNTSSEPAIAIAIPAAAATSAPLARAANIDHSRHAASTTVQPSKEWVLPARAKPGRKPSQAEPPTKRKAQNRASQRAFRERKQSYVSELEAKVSAYQRSEIDRSVEIQNIAKRLKEENESLKKQVAAWKEKALQLEQLLQSNSFKSEPAVGPGCKAPVHELRPLPLPRKGVLVSAESRSSPTVRKGEVRFADQVMMQPQSHVRPPSLHHDIQPDNHSSEEPLSPSKLPIPIAIKSNKAMKNSVWKIESSDLASAPVLSTSATSSSSSSSSSSSASCFPTFSFSSFSSSSPPPSLSILLSSTNKKVDLGQSAPPSKSLMSSPLLRGDLRGDGGCGFCTDTSPCVCADDVLDYDGGVDEPLVSPPMAAKSKAPCQSQDATSASLAAIPLPKRPVQHSSTPVHKMSIDSFNHVENQIKPQQKRKLWYTVDVWKKDAATKPPLPLRHNSVSQVAKADQPQRTKRNLWLTVPAATEANTSVAASKTSSEPACTGDPENCAACSTDPALAAFCEAVTTNVTTINGSTASLSKPSLTTYRTPNQVGIRSSDLALPPIRLSSASSSATTPSMLTPLASLGAPLLLPSHRLHQTETIPSAWKQIRSHPRFNQWQGGLDLLAEVVSRRSGSVHSPLLPERKREQSVEIEPVRRTSTSKSESNDRTTTHPSVEPLSSSQLPTKPEIVTQGLSTEPDSKRRRIVVEKEAVQEALALLDRSPPALSVLNSRLSPDLETHKRSRQSSHRQYPMSDRDGPCPCPWWRHDTAR